MQIEGVMTINGKAYRNSLTSWGHDWLFRAMFENIPFPSDLYLIVAGVSELATPYPGEPYPYNYPGIVEHDPETLGAYVAASRITVEGPIPYNTTDWDALGNPITEGFEPKAPIWGNSLFEFGQVSGTRLKITPFNIELNRVWSPTFDLNCPEIVRANYTANDEGYFFITDSPTLYNNSSKIFSRVYLYNYREEFPTSPLLPLTYSFSEGARFSYSFTLV